MEKWYILYSYDSYKMSLSTSKMYSYHTTVIWYLCIKQQLINCMQLLKHVLKTLIRISPIRIIFFNFMWTVQQIKCSTIPHQTASVSNAMVQCTHFRFCSHHCKPVLMVIGGNNTALRRDGEWPKDHSNFIYMNII